jgi:hypothetical protein
MKNDARVEIKEVDNGYIVETNYSCYGGEQVKVFTNWASAIEWIGQALRVTNGSKDDL